MKVNTTLGFVRYSPQPVVKEGAVVRAPGRLPESCPRNCFSGFRGSRDINNMQNRSFRAARRDSYSHIAPVERSRVVVNRPLRPVLLFEFRRIEQQPFLTIEPLTDIELRNILLRQRSEERRVGKECRSRWSAYH